MNRPLISALLQRIEVAAVLPILGAVFVACSGVGESFPENLDSRESLSKDDLGSLSQALCSGSGACTATTTGGHFGTWPNGKIKYQLMGNDFFFNTMVREAMDDWEALSYDMIEFQPSATATPRVQIFPGGGESPGFNGCSGVCSASMSDSNVYHELGHLIGFKHEMQRYDRRHYEIINNTQHCFPGPADPACDPATSMKPTNCSDPSNVARTSTSTATGMFGPFDFRSTMQYGVTHPDFTRWDESPIVIGAECDTTGTLPLPPQCTPNTDCMGSNCNGNLGVCPTCFDCNKLQPNGFPTRGDASAVVEMYRLAANSRWKVFKRAVNEVTSGAGATEPFDYTLNGTVSIAKDRSLAAAFRGTVIEIYVTGSDEHVWQKTKTGSSFGGWVDHGALPGSGFVSDPAAVSWATGRLDLVVRRGSVIYIKTWTSAVGWSTWQSLGTPGSTPASSPAIASWGANRLDVFVRGSNDQLYWRKCTANCQGNTGTWSAWIPIPGGTFRGKPTAVSRGVGVVDVFVHGMDAKLYGVQNSNDIWSNFYLANDGGTLKWDPSCPDCSSPAVMSRGAGKLDVIIRGTDDQMWITSWASPASTWSGYSVIGGILTSSPSGMGKARTTDRIDTFAVMGEERHAGFSRVYGPWWKEYTE